MLIFGCLYDTTVHGFFILRLRSDNHLPARNIWQMPAARRILPVPAIDARLTGLLWMSFLLNGMPL